MGRTPMAQPPGRETRACPSLATRGPSDSTLGSLIANLGFDEVKFPKPVFYGDTLRIESEVAAVRESASRPTAGIVTWEHRAINQRDEVVCTMKRSALLRKTP